MAEPISTSMMAVTGMAASAATIWAVIDPSITSISLAAIAAMVVIIPLWFKFKTDAMNAKLKEQDAKIEGIVEKSDGMNTVLVKAAADVAEAKGFLSGIEKAESKAAIIAVAKSEAQKDGRPTADLPLLPTQAQPVAVKDVPGVELTEEQLDKMIQELQAQKKSRT